MASAEATTAASSSTPAAPPHAAHREMQAAFTSVAQPPLAAFEALVDELLTMQASFQTSLAREGDAARASIAPQAARVNATMARLPAYQSKAKDIREQMARIEQRTAALKTRGAELAAQMSEQQRAEYMAYLKSREALSAQPSASAGASKVPS